MANRIPLESICAKKVPTLSPKYDGLIDYVDISSVDNTEKRIVSIQCISAKEAPSRAKQLLEAGDILVSTVRPNLNAVAMVEQPTNNLLVGSTGYCILRCNDSVDKRYVFHFCQSSYFVEDMTSQATGASYPAVSAGIVKSSTIPDHPIEKQKEITDRLDRVSELIALRKEQFAKLDQLVKSRFIELFGTTGKQVPLTDYVWFQEGPGVRSVDFTEDGTILLTGSNINNNEISFGHKSDRHISNELASGKYAHFMCDRDDILVVSSAIDPDKFDKKVVVVGTDKKYCLNTGIIRFKPNKQYLTLGYFREFLKTDYFKHQVSSEMRGIAQMHFGPSHLKQMAILLPNSIESQIEFEAFVQQTDKSKLAIQQSLDKLETLKKSLMQEYFG